MATTITGKLNKPANQFQAGESTGFGVRLGVQVYNPKTKEKQWTNYSAVLFARNPKLIQYMNDVLIENAVIELTATGELIQEYEGKYSIELLDAKLGYAYTGQQAAPQYSQGQQAQGSGFGQQQQQAPTPQAQYAQQGRDNQGFKAPAQQQQQASDFNQDDPNIPF